MFKNVASQKITVYAVDASTGLPKAGDAANITVYVSKDDGTVTVLGDTSATEADATNAKGDYLFDLTQAETNADKLRFTGKSGTANVVIVPQTIYTLPANFTALGISAGGHVLTVDTLTTYTGNTPQTGDAFARIGATGSGLTSLAPASTALSTVQWTNGRAANLDNLDAAISTRSTYAGGAVASVTAAVTVGGYSSGQDPATLVLDPAASGHNTAGTIGAAINNAAAGGGSGGLDKYAAARIYGAVTVRSGGALDFYGVPGSVDENTVLVRLGGTIPPGGRTVELDP